MTSPIRCTRCHTALASRAGSCEACIARERAARLPYAKVACDALETLGYLDLVQEVRRRQMTMEGPLPFDDTRYERLSQ